MINKSIIPNEEDGTNYDISIVAGPFKKALQSKVVSKAWSEQDSSDDNDNVKNNLFPKYPSPKKRRMMPKCARMIEKEFSPNLPKPPTTSINSTVTSTNKDTKIISKADELLLPNSDDGSTDIKTGVVENFYNHKEDKLKTSSMGNIQSTSEIENDHGTENYMQATSFIKKPIDKYLKIKISDLNVDGDLSTTKNIVVDSVPSTSSTIKTTNKNLHSIQDIEELTSFIMDASNEDFLTDHNSILSSINTCSNTDVLDSSKINDSSNESCCCKSISELKSLIIKKNKSQKSIQQQMMIQLTMLNKSNNKICKSIENLDYKVQVIMKSDSRVRDLAMPIPKLPSALLNIVPVKTNEELEIVERYLSSEHNEDNVDYREEMKSFLFVKIGCNSSFSAAIREAINSCFNYELLSEFSYKGKTKRKFTDLKLFKVIYETLSGFRKTPLDEQKFHSVTDNYLRHAPKRIQKPNP